MDQDLTFTLQSLNRLNDEDFAGLIYDFCPSAEWAARMAESRPFSTKKDLLTSAQIIWKGLSLKDQREALSQDFVTKKLSHASTQSFEDELREILDKNFQKVLTALNGLCADE